jgi:hypothetical protein
LAGEHTRGGGCGLIRFNARNLTRSDSRMKVRLMVLPDKLSGGAWPSSVRGVSCLLKCSNEQDPRPMLLPGSLSKGTHRGPLLIKQRKGRSTAGLYALNLLGYTRPTMTGTTRCDPERGN